MASIPNTSPVNFGIFAFTLSAALLSTFATAPADAVDDVPAAVPDALQPAASERVAFTWHAAGLQIYECRVLDEGGWAWALVAPEADLFDDKYNKVGTHGAGPNWTALDGSKIIGTLKARAEGDRPVDLSLLLLSAKSAGAPGKMAAVTSVQRLNTDRGGAPAQGCASQADAGRVVKKPYTADYVFFTAK